MVKVLSINSSEKRGTNKYPIEEGFLKENHGLVGDAHAGDWHRQVCIFDISSLDKLSEEEKAACEKTFSENITIDGIKVGELPIGSKLKVGPAVLEITQIGKEFVRDPKTHTPREIIMHAEGAFAIVKESGDIKVGDIVELL